MLGDTHGNPSAVVAAWAEARAESCEAVVQLGDFGFGWLWEGGECAFSAFVSDVARMTGIPAYFVDGNHENHDALNAIPVGADGLRVVADGVTHLPRGSKLRLGGTTFLALGGAYSVDRPYRTLGVDLWEGEELSDADVERAVAAGPADALLSHDCPAGLQTDGDVAWLTRRFGPGAWPGSNANQERVSRVLKSSGAGVVWHGHLHRRRTSDLGGVRVEGLNAETARGSTVVVEV